jgi:hypothetical protein
MSADNSESLPPPLPPRPKRPLRPETEERSAERVRRPQPERSGGSDERAGDEGDLKGSGDESDP